MVSAKRDSHRHRRISKALVLALLAASEGLDGFSNFIVTSTSFLTAPSAGPILVTAGTMLVLFHRMWSSIQDGHERTSPSKAVGFLLVPFFNIYWAFVVIWGFSKDYNAYAKRHALDLPALPETLFLTHTVLCLTEWVPVIGMPLFFINYVIRLVVAAEACDAINARWRTTAVGIGAL